MFNVFNLEYSICFSILEVSIYRFMFSVLKDYVEENFPSQAIHFFCFTNSLALSCLVNHYR
ncbi:hypothetical protein F5Y03DRAFT_378829 [Xylaria venustula]|nr:hypothetical protein F5Y03DRAFT_378829 [Xylaria venustula]